MMSTLSFLLLLTPASSEVKPLYETIVSYNMHHDVYATASAQNFRLETLEERGRGLVALKGFRV